MVTHNLDNSIHQYRRHHLNLAFFAREMIAIALLYTNFSILTKNTQHFEMGFSLSILEFFFEYQYSGTSI